MCNVLTHIDVYTLGRFFHFCRIPKHQRGIFILFITKDNLNKLIFESYLCVMLEFISLNI
jgi:hypothetical protein